MGIQDSLKSKLPNARNGIVKFMGEALHVVLLPDAELKQQDADDDLKSKELAVFIAEKFFDPATGKPAFDVEFLSRTLPRARLIELYKLYYKAQNGAGIDAAEKNSEATPRE